MGVTWSDPRPARARRSFPRAAGRQARGSARAAFSVWLSGRAAVSRRPRRPGSQPCHVRAFEPPYDWAAESSVGAS